MFSDNSFHEAAPHPITSAHPVGLIALTLEFGLDAGIEFKQGVNDLRVTIAQLAHGLF